eukprot:CAMPEP_0206606574 /NCGR_PEP_ID=MMETSP0325_2-20121206/51449_1 /ASSEMBLY_ACC=CAM_ASM_000347 /TAXON_ID=2866 /ORGANISM="Crypthecodinium cohnii, Strain Seligo" /LENGTH=233 /DNA_ID=CAMNT_0054123049 /DNA_START=71 /DNA_END=769 /DNA_ORIENTATION=-
MAQDTTSGASSSSNKVPKAKAKSVAETNHVFDKTRLCKFFFRGSCDKMEKCTFAHSPSELLPKPSFYKSQLCVDFQRHKSCPNGDDCNFAHSEEELQTPTKNPRIKSNSGKRLRERRSRRKQVEDAASSLPELTSSSSELPREAFDDRSSDYADKDECLCCKSAVLESSAVTSALTTARPIGSSQWMDRPATKKRRFRPLCWSRTHSSTWRSRADSSRNGGREAVLSQPVFDW